MAEALSVLPTQHPRDVVRALVGALPYVQRWAGQIVVVKVGGAMMGSSAQLDVVCQDLVMLRAVGVKVVLVHGGGPAVSDMGRRLGLETTFVDGLRVTDDETMRVAQLVQIGGISRDLIAGISRSGGRGVGLAGHDGGGWLRGQIRRHVSRATGEVVDLGRVGDIVRVDTELLLAQVAAGFIPVIAPVAVDDEFRPLNVNADTVASKVAGALGAPRLLFMSDVEGIRGPAGFVSEVDAATLHEWIGSGIVSGGMVPKVEACLEALTAGVPRVSIMDGRVEHAALLELLTDAGAGTLVVP